MKRLFALIFALVICLTAFTACGGQPSEAVQETTEKAKLTDEVTRIKTPYAEICVPKSFENNVKNTVTKESPYTVAFTSVKDDTQLFEVVFNGKGSVLMGTIVGDEGNTVLYMNVPALKKDSPNFNENLAYQQGVNTITNHLQEDYDFRVNEEVVEEDAKTFDIETDVTTFKYPAKWKDKITVKAEADKVSFSAGETPVFELRFKAGEGYWLGDYKNTPIYIVDYPVKDEAQIAMQKDINVLIEHLRAAENFKDGTESQTSDASESK